MPFWFSDFHLAAEGPTLAEATLVAAMTMLPCYPHWEEKHVHAVLGATECCGAGLSFPSQSPQFEVNFLLKNSDLEQEHMSCLHWAVKKDAEGYWERSNLSGPSHQEICIWNSRKDLWFCYLFCQQFHSLRCGYRCLKLVSFCVSPWDASVINRQTMSRSQFSYKMKCSVTILYLNELLNGCASKTGQSWPPNPLGNHCPSLEVVTDDGAQHNPWLRGKYTSHAPYLWPAKLSLKTIDFVF